MPVRARLKRYPFPVWDVDRTGNVKRRTLEFFVFNEGWHTAERIRREPGLDTWEDIYPDTRAVSIRLLRYTRAGLLQRREIRPHWYEYTITMEGERRWMFLAKKFGLLDPEKAKTVAERKEALERREEKVELLEKHEVELTEKLIRVRSGEGS